MILEQAGLKDRAGKNTFWQTMAARLVEPGAVAPVAKPRPRPPLPARPHQLSVTRIETLIRDPYAIYARHILQLMPVDPITAMPDPARRGTLYHAAIGEFLQAYPVELPPKAEAELLRLGAVHFEPLRDFPALSGFWWPRFRRIAHWLVLQEPELRAGVRRVVAEISGGLTFPVKGEDFTLTCRADRIDIFAGGDARIIDFKTGAVPSGPMVRSGLAPQLTLQAAVLARGGFAQAGPLQTTEIAYISLTGGEPPGVFIVPRLEALVMTLADDHLAGVIRLLSAYADPAQPYLPRAVMQMEDDASDYDHLSRYREWALSGGGT
jgi:ATP-dependent helicase/nuclease subunit B